MIIPRKTIVPLALFLCPLFANAEYQNPTETPFYKRATGQDTEYEQKEAERQKDEAMSTYNQAFEILTSKLETTEAIDVDLIAKEWSTNAARAQLKYDKPHVYRGVLEKVTVMGQDVVMVMNSKNGNGVNVNPFFIQGVLSVVDGKRQFVDAVGAIEYAAQFDAGQEFTMLCDRAYPKQLNGCLMFAE